MKISNNLIWIIVLSIIALVAYTVIGQDRSLKKLNLDKDGFNVEFDEIKEIPNQELESRQAKLEAELSELKSKYKNQKKQEPNHDAVPRPQQVQFNLNGRWQSQEGDFYDIAQYGNAITVQEISPIYGITAIGQGSLQQNMISVNYHTALNTYGTGQLKIMDNGRRIEGTFTDASTGMQTQANLFR